MALQGHVVRPEPPPTPPPACLNSLSWPAGSCRAPCPPWGTAGSRRGMGGGWEGGTSWNTVAPGPAPRCHPLGVAWQGWGAQLLSTQALVGSCSHSTNQLAEGQRSPSWGTPRAPPGSAGQAASQLLGKVAEHLGLDWLREEGRSGGCGEGMVRCPLTSDLLGSFALDLLALFPVCCLRLLFLPDFL